MSDPFAERSVPVDQHEWVIELLAVAEVASLDQPHIVVAVCQTTGAVLHTGPYPSALEAAVAADVQAQPGESLSVKVAPLFAP